MHIYCILILWIIAAECICIGVAKRFLIFHAEPANWDNARKTCINQYEGSLLQPGDINFKTFIATTHRQLSFIHNQSTSLKMWISNSTHLSQWISYEGCFRKGNSRFVEVNNINECSNFCVFKEKFMFYGMQGKLCFCYKAIPLMSRQSPMDCYINCQGTHGFKCGGKNRISLYRIYTSANDNILQFRRCTTISCTANAVTRIHAHFCNSTHSTLCVNERTLEKRRPFHEADNECIPYGGMQGLGDANMCAVMESLQYGVQYWVRLNRYEVISPDDQAVSPYKCSYVSYDGQYMESATDSCRREYPYLCQIDIENVERICDGILSKNTTMFSPDTLNSESLGLFCNQRKLESSRSMRDFYESGLVAVIVCCAIVMLWCCITVICCIKKSITRKKKADLNIDIEMDNVKYSPVKTIESIEETLE